MTFFRPNDIVEVFIKIVICDHGSLNSREMRLNSWTEAGDVLVVALRPTVIGTALVIRAQL